MRSPGEFRFVHRLSRAARRSSSSSDQGPRKSGFKDLGYYIAAGYEGLVTRSRLYIVAGKSDRAILAEHPVPFMGP